MTDLNPYEEGLALELQEAKDCIKALQKALKDQSSVSDRLAEQLATCEKYRDAYAECDRIGTQAVRDLEDKLALMVFERDEVIKFERDEAWKRAAHLEKMWGEAEAKLAECEARLRKAVEALDMLVRDCEADYPPSHGAIKHFAIATLAEISSEAALIKGESREVPDR